MASGAASQLDPAGVVWLLGAGVFALFTLTSGAGAATKTRAMVVAAGVAAHALRVDLGVLGGGGAPAASAEGGAPSGAPRVAPPHAGAAAAAAAAAARGGSALDELDGELYTLRVRDGGTRHLALRQGGSLLRRVRRAAELGASRGNSASGARAAAALEDFFTRYHWALLHGDDGADGDAKKGPDTRGLIPRTLATLRDTRALALNALAEIAFAVPLSHARPVRRAVEAARVETLTCLETLATKLARTDPVATQVAAAAWRGPTPHDPRRSLPHNLFA
jgi:hypothetical protein